MLFVQAQRQQAGGERALLGQLAAGTSVYLEPGVRYNLVPRAWLVAWRSYMAAAGKKVRPQFPRRCLCRDHNPTITRCAVILTGVCPKT